MRLVLVTQLTLFFVVVFALWRFITYFRAFFEHEWYQRNAPLVDHPLYRIRDAFGVIQNILSTYYNSFTLYQIRFIRESKVWHPLRRLVRKPNRNNGFEFIRT